MQFIKKYCGVRCRTVLYYNTDNELQIIDVNNLNFPYLSDKE